MERSHEQGCKKFPNSEARMVMPTMNDKEEDNEHYGVTIGNVLQDDTQCRLSWYQQLVSIPIKFRRVNSKPAFLWVKGCQASWMRLAASWYR